MLQEECCGVVEFTNKYMNDMPVYIDYIFWIHPTRTMFDPTRKRSKCIPYSILKIYQNITISNFELRLPSIRNTGVKVSMI